MAHNAHTIVSLGTAVSELVHDGDTVALEGFTHLIPCAAGHEIIRQRRRDLTLVRMTPDIVYDQLIGAGCARKLVFSWGGNPGVGSLHRFRDAIENGWPTRSRSRSTATPGMANRYVAGASGLPFAVLRGYRGTDLPEHTDDDQADHLPVHRRGADRGAGARPRRRRSSTRSAPTAQGNVQLWGHHRRAEGGGARRQALARHRRGDRRRARAGAGRGRAARRGSSRAWPRCRAARIPSYAHGLLRPRQRATTARGTTISQATRERLRATWLEDAVTLSDTTDEMMIVAAARALPDGAACFVGIGLPSAPPPTSPGARTRPTSCSIYESGAIGAKPTRLPLSIGDGILAETADAVVACPRSSTTGCSPGGSTSASSARRRSTATRTSTRR